MNKIIILGIIIYGVGIVMPIARITKHWYGIALSLVITGLILTIIGLFN